MPPTAAPTANCAHAAMSPVDPRPAMSSSVLRGRSKDSGRIINPLDLAWSVAWRDRPGARVVFREHFIYTGRPMLTGSFMDYLLPTATDFPPSERGAGGKAFAHQTRSGQGRARAVIIRSRVSSPHAVPRALTLGVHRAKLPLSPPRVWSDGCFFDRER